MRRRLALLVLPLIVVALLLRPRLPADHELRLHFGARGAAVREVHLVFERGDKIARDLSLWFRAPDGAPSGVNRTVSLAPGDYRVGVRLVVAEGERHVAREIHVEDDAPIELDLEVR